MASNSDEEIVVLELTDPSAVEEEATRDEISISTSDIRCWNLPLILCYKNVKVLANRKRLVKESSYFRGLLGGSFSESSLHHVLIQWHLEAVLLVLQFMNGCLPSITFTNFLLLLEAALYFGVENLLVECQTWFHKITSSEELHAYQMPLDAILEIWNFGLEHGINFLAELCEGYLARNFVGEHKLRYLHLGITREELHRIFECTKYQNFSFKQIMCMCVCSALFTSFRNILARATSCNTFADIPYDLLHSCIKHPQLTVESEKQFCEALLIWLVNNMKSLECSSINSRSDYFDILKKVKVSLLPLGFAAGQRRHFSQFVDGVICTILDLMKDYSSKLMHAITDGDSDDFRIRLTKYSEKIMLSGCTQITVAFLFLAVLPHDLDATLKTRIIRTFIELDHYNGDHYQILQKPLNVLSFEGVCEVDVSKCPKLHFGATIIWLHLAFPSLKILKASHCLHFKMEDLHYLLQKCPLICEVDLTVDVSPVIPTKASVLTVNAEAYQPSDGTPYKMSQEKKALLNIGKDTLGSQVLSKISKLTLEGRHDINDMELICISRLSDSLSYLNIKGCTLVTDTGISKLISECRNINSLVLSYTSFGRNSIMALCSSHTYFDEFRCVHRNHKYSDIMAFRLQQLHIDGCKGVDETSMLQLMNHTYMLKILSLRETSLVDDALYEFMGSSLESLDVSETVVSVEALTFVIRRNPLVKVLKANGCRNLHRHECNDLTYTSGASFEDIFCELGKKCSLEEVAFGWGFSSTQLEKLKFHISNVRAVTVGLGASLDHHALCVLPKICPLLESVILIFQVISDTIVRSILESLKHLQVLWLCCCLGDLTSLSFQISMPKLRTLRLDWVTPWMTNSDLVILAQNCSNLVELSLSGCKLLDSAAQEIISEGWPGLTLIHLEDCGKVTADGVSSLFNCKAVEDLLLRHNGRGIGRNFISDATSKLPLLRKLALDLCDSCEGGIHSPSHADRCYLSHVRISRCTSQMCGFELQSMESFKPVHKETIILEWNVKELRTTVVKERI